jgi:hypothetical protein
MNRFILVCFCMACWATVAFIWRIPLDQVAHPWKILVLAAMMLVSSVGVLGAVGSTIYLLWTFKWRMISRNSKLWRALKGP